MQDANGNLANPIPTTEELQHVVDIGFHCPYVLPRMKRKSSSIQRNMVEVTKRNASKLT